MFQSYSSQPSLTPDDDVFKHLSLTYANNHAKMSRGKYNKWNKLVILLKIKYLNTTVGVACKSATPSFENGITNGAAWYPLTGGMQVNIVLPHHKMFTN